MERVEVVLWSEESVPESLDRLKYALIEIGVRMQLKTVHDDYTVLEFFHAERLDGRGDKDKPAN